MPFTSLPREKPERNGFSTPGERRRLAPPLLPRASCYFVQFLFPYIEGYRHSLSFHPPAASLPSPSHPRLVRINRVVATNTGQPIHFIEANMLGICTRECHFPPASSAAPLPSSPPLPHPPFSLRITRFRHDGENINLGVAL